MKILIYTFFREDLSGLIKSEFPEISVLQTHDLSTAIREMADTEVLIVNKPCEELIDAAPKLKWIQSLSSGVDYLPLKKIEERHIILTNTAGIHSGQMSEYAIAAMVMLSRNYPVLMRQQMEGRWSSRVPQGEIFGSTVGILGLGNIGKAVAEKAKVFGMNVIGINRSGKDVPFVDEVYTMEGLYKVAEQSDYVINLLPLTEETYHIIDKGFFDVMQPSACFINIGRGPTVKEADFMQALEDESIRGAFSDVFETEPLKPESPVWQVKNLVITPHICGINEHYFEKALDVISPNIHTFLVKGKPLSHIVNLTLGY